MEDPFAQSSNGARSSKPLEPWKTGLACGALGVAAIIWADSETWALQKPFKTAAIVGIVCAGVGLSAAVLLNLKRNSDNVATNQSYSDRIAASRSVANVAPIQSRQTF